MVRMRKVKESEHKKCICCGKKQSETAQMYEINVGSITFPICRICNEELFHKTLSASCEFNSRMKSQKEITLINKENLKAGKWSK